MRSLAPFLLATAMHAETCLLKGHVYDKDSGSPMPGHVVRATQFDWTRTATANRDGYFEFPALSRGFWSITSDTPGYRLVQEAVFAVDVHDGQPGCRDQKLYLERYGERERLEEEIAANLLAQRCRLSLSGHVYENYSGATMPGHVVRATNGNNIVTAVANREGFFEFLNLAPGDWWITSDMAGYKPAQSKPFATLHSDSRCISRNLHLRRFGPREQLEEAVQSVPGYAVAFYQLVLEAFGARRP